MSIFEVTVYEYGKKLKILKNLKIKFEFSGYKSSSEISKVLKLRMKRSLI